ncbi:unnamed protein product [Lactuca virosa]|uniref:Uncharacterized protein n=1 Tax=Lactuca virosa TaxID=75947 RepID=A0AAU9N6P7_9ASTR|nr:unnamed protein product [Lactuca virosa]
MSSVADLFWNKMTIHSFNLFEAHSEHNRHLYTITAFAFVPQDDKPENEGIHHRPRTTIVASPLSLPHLRTKYDHLQQEWKVFHMIWNLIDQVLLMIAGRRRRDRTPPYVL